MSREERILALIDAAAADRNKASDAGNHPLATAIQEQIATLYNHLENEREHLRLLEIEELRHKRKREMEELQILNRQREEASAATATAEAPSTPGDSEVMFIVLLIKRSGKRNNITFAEPVGTSFALSETLLFTAAHNVCDGNNEPLPEIGIVREYSDPVPLTDIILLEYENHCSDENEDWAVYRRSAGSFTHWVNICLEEELPQKGVRIGIKDFPVGLLTVGSISKITVDSFHTKVCHYEANPGSAGTLKKRKFGVAPAKFRRDIDERYVLVRGGRVKGSCGAAYFCHSGKVFAFHNSSVDDGQEELCMRGKRRARKSTGATPAISSSATSSSSSTSAPVDLTDIQEPSATAVISEPLTAAGVICGDGIATPSLLATGVGMGVAEAHNIKVEDSSCNAAAPATVENSALVTEESSVSNKINIRR